MINTRYLESSKNEVLSDEEVRNHISKSQAGITLSRDILVYSNLGLVFSTITRYLNDASYEDDLISEGIIGLIKAIDTFDVKKNIKFSSYATICIRNEALMFLRQINKSKSLSLDEEITLKEGHQKVHRIDTVKSTFSFDDRETMLIVYEVLRTLNERDRQIFELYFFEDKTQNEIGKLFGITRMTVSKINSKILTTIKSKLEGFVMTKK